LQLFYLQSWFAGVMVVVLIVGSIVAVIVWIALVAGIVGLILKATLRRLSE
jgi:hypothetical protein